MSNFLENLKDPSWWLGVVLIGIIINLFSSWLKPKFDSYISNISNSYKKRITQQKEKTEQKIQSLIDDDEFDYYNNELNQNFSRLNTQTLLLLIFIFSGFFIVNQFKLESISHIISVILVVLIFTCLGFHLN